MLYHGNAMDYIYETPDILQYILEHKKEILEDSSRVLKDKKISEIYLTGSGSSYNAAVAVADFAKKLLGIRVTPVYPVMLIEDYEFISKLNIDEIRIDYFNSVLSKTLKIGKKLIGKP